MSRMADSNARLLAAGGMTYKVSHIKHKTIYFFQK